MDCKTRSKQIKNCKVNAPPSKSMAHRAILGALLCNEGCVVSNVDLSADIKATLASSLALGKEGVFADGKICFGKTNKVKKATIDANESGSTLRFLIPICAALGVETTFVGSGKLPERPYKILADVMSKHGVSFDKTHGLPMTIKGKLTSGVYQITGDVSSQYITGLLYALPLVEGDSKIVLTSPLQSKGYVDMTLQALKHFGIVVVEQEDGYFIKGNQTYKAKDFCVEGDFSNGAFWLVLGVLNDGIEVAGLDENSLQGDKAILDVLKQMGADITWQEGVVKVGKSNLQGITVDVSQIPDLAPILSVALACADGIGHITNASRLKIKESDRLQAIFDNLTAVGVKCELGVDSIKIFGNKNIVGGVTKGFNDHRIVMSMAVLSTKTQEGISVSDMHAINKSYPNFFDEFKKLGGVVDVINLG